MQKYKAFSNQAQGYEICGSNCERNVAAIRIIRQLDATDCGPAALATILAYWGRLEPLYRLRELAGTTQAGTTLWGLARAARQLGLEAKGYEANLDALKELELPAILHWEHDHYVVLEAITHNRVYLADPEAGKRWLSLEEFSKKWTGKVLCLKPGEDFQPGRFLGKRGFTGLFSHLVHYEGAFLVLIQLLLGTTVIGLLSLGAPILSQILFDQVLSLNETSLLPTLLAAIFFLAIFRTLFDTVRSLLSSQLTLRLSYRMRLNYYGHLLKLPMRIHETRLTGDLLTRFGDLSRVRSVLSSLLVNLPATLFGLIFSLSLLVLYNGRLALISLLTVPFQILYLFWLAPRLRDNSMATRRKAGDVESSLLGGLEGLWTLKAFQAENWAFDHTIKQIDKWMDLRWKQVLLSNLSRLISGFLTNLGSLIVLWYGAIQVLALELTVGQLVAAYALMRSTLSSISDVTDQIEDVQEGIVASDRLLEMMELPKEVSKARYATLSPLQRGLSIKNLSFSYLPEQPILSNLNFDLPKGSYTALLGENGSGKSTLAALITQMMTPNQGAVFWDNTALSDIALETVRANLLYLKQEVPIFYATLWDNLFFGQQGSLEEANNLISDIGFDQVVARLPEGLQTTIGGDSPYRFSTGERQMLGLARALLSRAHVLILDEPTATLDQNREQTIVQRLAELKGSRTLLVITHRPALIEPADQILTLQDGQISLEKVKPLI